MMGVEFKSSFLESAPSIHIHKLSPQKKVSSHINLAQFGHSNEIEMRRRKSVQFVLALEINQDDMI